MLIVERKGADFRRVEISFQKWRLNNGWMEHFHIWKAWAPINYWSSLANQRNPVIYMVMYYYMETPATQAGQSQTIGRVFFNWPWANKEKDSICSKNKPIDLNFCVITSVNPVLSKILYSNRLLKITELIFICPTFFQIRTCRTRKCYWPIFFPVQRFMSVSAWLSTKAEDRLWTSDIRQRREPGYKDL